MNRRTFLKALAISPVVPSVLIAKGNSANKKPVLDKQIKTPRFLDTPYQFVYGGYLFRWGVFHLPEPYYNTQFFKLCLRKKDCVISQILDKHDWGYRDFVCDYMIKSVEMKLGGAYRGAI